MVEKERTSIALFAETKDRLDSVKICKDETYDSLLNRLLDERCREAQTIA